MKSNKKGQCINNISRVGSLLGVCLAMMLIVSCNDDDDDPLPPAGGKLMIRFEHHVSGQPVTFNDMKYVNAAGNPFEVTDIQWFISDITLHKADGSSEVLEGDGTGDFVHYIDTGIPSTLTWEKEDTLQAGKYTGIAMTFGLKGPKNLRNYFTDPPESDMEWPAPLGGDQGGYHYMKLNGFWLDLQQKREAFNFHLGVGPKKDNQGNTLFVQNWFETMLPNSSFEMESDETKEIVIVMNIENWFHDPNLYDFNEVGAGIMNNQDAQQLAKENGNNVFSIGSIKSHVQQ